MIVRVLVELGTWISPIAKTNKLPSSLHVPSSNEDVILPMVSYAARHHRSFPQPFIHNTTRPIIPPSPFRHYGPGAQPSSKPSSKPSSPTRPQCPGPLRTENLRSRILLLFLFRIQFSPALAVSYDMRSVYAVESSGRRHIRQSMPDGDPPILPIPPIAPRHLGGLLVSGLWGPSTHMDTTSPLYNTDNCGSTIQPLCIVITPPSPSPAPAIEISIPGREDKHDVSAFAPRPLHLGSYT